jgi:RNA-directed DNA polymerase
MKESYREDLANHPDPESCVYLRKEAGEALTGAGAGEPLSRENRSIGTPTPLSYAEGHTERRAIASAVSGPARSKNLGTHRNSLHENREGSRSSGDDQSSDRAGKAERPTPAMHDREQSDGFVVPLNRGNETGRPVEDCGEGRDPVKGTRARETRAGRSAGNDVSTGLARVRQVALKDRKARFTALLHHVTPERLRAAFERVKRTAAPGIDGVTKEHYAAQLAENLRGLHQRVQGGTYRATPSRRAYISKADGRQRPLGIAALEDKIVQSATAEVLNAVYEADFLGTSYGFRPGRGTHDALDALAVGLLRRKVNWVLDADIRGFFDQLDHGWLVRFVKHRIGDERIVRLIRKWLRAGVIEAGEWKATEQGTPQGATISPLLANVYLHHVFDLWAHDWRRRHASGDVVFVRYADDFVVGFERQEEAEQFLAELKTRLGKFGLDLHAEKTRLIRFGRTAALNRKIQGLRKPESFVFLGLRHLSGRSQAGKFLLQRHTEKSRMQARIAAVKAELRRRMHQPIAEQGPWLRDVVRGYFAYHAVPTNVRALGVFRTALTRHWFRTLRRRDQRRRMTWEVMKEVAAFWLPPAKILHPWPEARLDAKYQDRSRMR